MPPCGRVVGLAQDPLPAIQIRTNILMMMSKMVFDKMFLVLQEFYSTCVPKMAILWSLNSKWARNAREIRCRGTACHSPPMFLTHAPWQVGSAWTWYHSVRTFTDSYSVL